MSFEIASKKKAASKEGRRRLSPLKWATWFNKEENENLLVLVFINFLFALHFNIRPPLTMVRQIYCPISKFFYTLNARQKNPLFRRHS